MASDIQRDGHMRLAIVRSVQRFYCETVPHASQCDPLPPKLRAALGWVGTNHLVADLGANDGTFASNIARLGNRVIACDFEGNAQLAQKASGLDAVACDLTAQLPFRTGSIDVVVALGVIECVPDDLSFLRECYRVLTIHGRLVWSALNVASLPNRLMLLRGKSIDAALVPGRLVLHRYSLSSAAELLSDAGFYPKALRKCAGSYPGWRQIYAFLERALPPSFACEIAILSEKSA